MTYNCEEKAIIIPLTEEPDITYTTLTIYKTCCGDAEEIVYCNPENITNLLELDIIVNNLVQIKEDPSFPCYIEATWDEEITLDLTDVVSFTGTKESYINSVLILTETIDTSYFNTVHNVYTSMIDAGRAYIFTLSFTLSNGITINYDVRYAANINTFSDANCEITTFNETIDYEIECANPLIIDEAGIHFPIELIDGYYTASWEGTESCFIVECDETLACLVTNYITDIVNTKCYDCNNKKSIEKSMKILMYYETFLSSCKDCCEKCKLYEKIRNILDNCKDC